MTESENEALVRAFIAAWNERDREAIGRAFRRAIRYSGASYPTATGRDEALALCDPFLAADAIDWRIVNCAMRGSVVFTERVDTFEYAGKPGLIVPACGVFELVKSGLIVRWRDYLDGAGLGDLF